MIATRIHGNTPGFLLLLVAFLGLAACAETAEIETAANQRYLEGRAFHEQGGEPALLQAIDLYSLALAADSTFAPAWASLAAAFADIGGNYNVLAPEESWPRAREAADRAFQLDEGLAASHLAQALVMGGADWDWMGAELAYQRALAIEPDNIDALNGYAWFLYGLARPAEAATFAGRASELAPGSADAFLLYATTGDAAGQLAAAREAIAADPTNPYGYWASALIHTWEGEYPQAIELLEQQLPLMEGDVVDEVALMGYVYGRMGREDDARAMLQRLDEVAAEGRYVSPVLKGWIHSGLGNAEQALTWLRTGYEDRAHRSGLGMNSFAPIFDPIRDTPGFAELLQDMGLQR